MLRIGNPGLVHAIVLFVLVVPWSPASAVIVCVDKDGKSTFSETQCAHNAKPGAKTDTGRSRQTEESVSVFRGPTDAPVPLDTPDPNYREYMDKVKQRIYSKWGYPYEAQARGLKGTVVIEFHIARDGSLQFVGIKQSSGEELLDRFATIAVKLGSRYPPLPESMERDVLPVVGHFVYTLRPSEK